MEYAYLYVDNEIYGWANLDNFGYVPEFATQRATQY